MPRIQDIGAFNAVREAGLSKLVPPCPALRSEWAPAAGAMEPKACIMPSREPSSAAEHDFVLASVGCFGACFRNRWSTCGCPGQPLLILQRVQANDALRILHDPAGNLTPDHIYCKIEEWDHITGHIRYGDGYPEILPWNEVPFFKGQKKIVLRNCGLINPDDIEEYIGIGGYQALYKVLIDANPDSVIEQIKASKLRGRGGAGYPTGNKWEFLPRQRPSPNTSSAMPTRAIPART